jgi:ribose transport system substrate-binding protein
MWTRLLARRAILTRAARLLPAAALGLAALLPAGCQDTGAGQSAGTQTGGEPAEADARPTVALVMKTLTNPFFIEMEQGARRAAADLDVELLVRTAAQETSIEQQIAIVDTLIREEVDAIVIAPGDSVRLIPVLHRAQEQGIAIINIDNRLDPAFAEQIGLTGVPFISVDNEAAAHASASRLAAEADGPAEAMIIEGIREAANAEARRQGAARAFAEHPDITVVASETANWKIDEGYAVARTSFARHPGIDLVFCANDMMALGVIRYLEETGRDGVRVAAFDNLAEARQAIRDGQLVATVDQRAAQQGYMGVDFAVRALSGAALPAETLVDAVVVDAGSV